MESPCLYYIYIYTCLITISTMCLSVAQMREILQGGGNSMSDGDTMSEANTSMSSPFSSSARNDSMMNGTPSTPSSTPNKALDFSPIRATDSSYLSSAEKSILVSHFHNSGTSFNHPPQVRKSQFMEWLSKSVHIYKNSIFASAD